MKHFFEEFKKFAIRGNAVDLAVGVVVGAAFNSVVHSLVTDVITPPIGLLMGGIDFSALSISLGGDAAIAYGAFIQSLVSFLITAFILFLVVKAMNSMLAKHEQTQPKPAETPEVALLEDIRDLLKEQARR